MHCKLYGNFCHKNTYFVKGDDLIRLNDCQMEERRQHILRCALECFCSTGIEETTIVQVAKSAQVGEATIYRYFNNKTELVVQTGQLVWNAASQHFTDSFDNDAHTQKTGIEQMRALLRIFITLYQKQGDIFKFIYDFDNYVLRQPITEGQRMKCKKSVHSLKVFFYQAVKKGTEDGSIREWDNWEDFYWTVVNILNTLSQKLLLYGHLINPGDSVASERQLELACEIIINGMTATATALQAEPIT